MDEQEAVAVLKSLPSNLSSQVFPHLQVEYAAQLLKEVSPDLFSEIVSKIDPQQGAAIFTNLPNETRRAFVEHLPDKIKKQIQELLTYPEASAGRIMTTEFIAFHTDVKVRDCIQKIRALSRTRAPASYVYVIDNDNHLVGVINMRDLLLASGEASLETVVRKDVFAVNAFTDREELVNELSKRRYFAVPVVDNENHLLGVVRSDQLISHVQDEMTEDILKMTGAGGDERAFSPVGYSVRKRLGWLYVNLATAFLAASVVALFEDVIAKVTVLAVFLPVVAGQGGNAGAQTLAVVMRGLVMREVPRNKFWKLILKETWVGALNGVLIGVVTAAIAWAWHDNPYLGLVIGLAMIVNLIAAGLSGAIIPLAMKALGFDPAQSSSIFLTTVTDVVGFFSFLGFALVFQSYLI